MVISTVLGCDEAVAHLAMKGAPPRAIQELAGHQSITVTNRYMHLAPGEIALLDRSGTSGQQVANEAKNYLKYLKVLGE